MASIDFRAGQGSIYSVNGGGSGLGFYGAGGFGTSVRVGEYQGTTYITNAAGTQQGAQANNNKWAHASSGYMLGSSSPLVLTSLPNNDSTLNVRFTHSTAVQVQNVQAWVYDRVSQYSTQSGVTCKAAEVIHPGITQVAGGSGDSSWTTFNAGVTGTYLSLAPSPGISGIWAGNGSNSVRPDTQHDWYIAMSVSPDSIGSKSQFALFLVAEYL